MTKVFLSGILLLCCCAIFGQDTLSVKDMIFEKVETEADYPGGSDTWKSFLEKNLNANVPVENGAPVGYKKRQWFLYRQSTRYRQSSSYHNR